MYRTINKKNNSVYLFAQNSNYNKVDKAFDATTIVDETTKYYKQRIIGTNSP